MQARSLQIEGRILIETVSNTLLSVSTSFLHNTVEYCGGLVFDAGTFRKVILRASTGMGLSTGMMILRVVSLLYNFHDGLCLVAVDSQSCVLLG